MRAVAFALLVALAGCSPSSGTSPTGLAQDGTPLVRVTITTANGARTFAVELAKTPAQQEQGLMFRTDLKPDGGMLFAPYLDESGAPKQANFWMKNTPTSLDIIFIRADGTIARIAENTVPFSEALVPSGEPVAAVLELIGGRAAAARVAQGDKVTWPR